MAGVLGTLAVAITGKTSGLDKAFGDAERRAAAFGRKMEGTGKSISSIGKGISGVGKSMTKYITAPILGAATAAAGLVATLGWGRLKAMDAAKAQLEGFGYSLKDVERISEQVNRAVTGTVMTMAEGTSAAAGALAAGVKEGEELEKYIKRVGNAAVGANRDVGEMAMIFNRVQGAGKLMTRELNMIEQGMPGFSMTMAEHLGVPLDEFKKMVTGGKVSSAEFMTVMDDFAGGMADAYAKTWDGMVANTKANIGIIGQNLLGGVFEQSKESIAEFLELLRSDDVQAWAKETGEKIGETFERIVDTVKNAISWWADLDDDTKKMIKTIAGMLVVAGPVLMIIGGIVTKIGALITAIGTISTAIAGIGGAAVLGPVAAVVAAIAGLAVAVIYLWKNSEEFRDGVIGIWDVIKDTAGPVIDMLKENVGKMVDAMGPALKVLKNAFMDFLPILEIVGAVLGTVFAIGASIVVGALNGIVNAIAPLINAIGGLLSFVINTVNAIVALFRGDFAGAWEYIKKAGQGILDFIGGLVDAIFGYIGGMVQGVINFFKNLFNAIVGHSIIPDLVNGIINWVKKLPGKVLESVKTMMSNFVSGIQNRISSVTGAIGNVISSITNRVKSLPGELLQAGRNMIANLAQGIRDRISSVTGAIGNVASKIRDFLPFSPAKEGPLRVEPNFSGYLTEGIEGAKRDVSMALDGVLADVSLQGDFAPARISSGETTLNINFTGLPAGTDEESIKQFLLRALREPDVARRVDEATHISTRGRLAPQGV